MFGVFLAKDNVFSQSVSPHEGYDIYEEKQERFKMEAFLQLTIGQTE